MTDSKLHDEARAMQIRVAQSQIKTTDSDTISSSLQRAIHYLEMEVQVKRHHLRVILDSLAFEFKNPESRSFNPDFHAPWRSLQAQVELKTSLLKMLGDVEMAEAEHRNTLLKSAVGFMKSQQEYARASFHSACQTLMYSFQRPNGPSGVSSAEGDWIRYQTEVQVYDDVLEKLAEAQKELGLV